VFQQILSNIARALNKYHIPYMVIGGQAILLHGEPRLTKDIDITLGVGIEEIETVLNIVNALSLKVLVDNPEDFVSKTMVLPVLNTEPNIRVDLIFSFTSYEKQAIERAVEVLMKDARVKFASVEDMIIHKNIAGRPRDIEDIRSIMLKNINFDQTYILQWLIEFDTSLNETYSDVFDNLIKEIE